MILSVWRHHCSDGPRMIRSWSVTTRLTHFLFLFCFLSLNVQIRQTKPKNFFQAILGFQAFSESTSVSLPSSSHQHLEHFSGLLFAHSRAFSGLCFKPLLNFFTKLWINSLFLFSLDWSCCITTELTIVKNNLLNEVVFKFWERIFGENSLASY